RCGSGRAGTDDRDRMHARAASPGWVRWFAVLGVVLQLPLAGLAAFARLAGPGTGPHAGNAALALALPATVAAILAAAGLLVSVAVCTWSWATAAGRTAGWI